MTPEQLKERRNIVETLRLVAGDTAGLTGRVSQETAQVLIEMLDKLANGFYRNVYSISDNGYSVVTPLSQEDWEVYVLSCKLIGETPDPQLKPKELE